MLPHSPHGSGRMLFSKPRMHRVDLVECVFAGDQLVDRRSLVTASMAKSASKVSCNADRVLPCKC
jgi:hypothetical protein